MVEDRITDGARIAQLLASELTGLETGPLAAVSVVDADPDATPAPGGTEAFAVAVDEERVGRAVLFPDAVAVELDDECVTPAAVREGAAGADVTVDRVDGTVTVTVESGAAVKRTVDALVAGLEGGSD